MGSVAADGNIFDGANYDWESYIAYRPVYSSEFYERIYDYHRVNGGQWNVAHDIGTGPGIVAEVLAQRFEKVVASDPSEFHVAVAKEQLKSLLDDKITIHRERAEGLSQLGYPPGSVDMVTIAECLPLMDTEKAFANCAELLRPGGTLAIWFYGPPILADEGQEKSQTLWQKVISRAWDKVRPMKGTMYETCWYPLVQWFDNVHFPEKDWTSVSRRKWNNDWPISFLEENHMDFEVKHTNGIRSDEKIEETIDRDFWAKEGGVEFIRGFVGVQLPWQMTDDEAAKAHLEELYVEIEETMGGRSKISWPVILMLATRR